MQKFKKVLFSFVLIISMVLTGFPAGNLNAVFAEGEKPVQLGVNGSEETTGYDTIADAINAIEEQVKADAANKANTYEIYLAVKATASGYDYAMPFDDYVFPEVKRISFVGGINETGGGFYTRVSIGFNGNLTFPAGVEFRNVQVARTVDKPVKIKAKKMYMTGDNLIGNYYDLLMDNTEAPITINCEKFYSCSAKIGDIIDAGEYTNTEDFVNAAKATENNALSIVNEFASAQLDADDVYCVGRTKLRMGTNHIGNFHVVNTMDNKWQPADCDLDVMGYGGINSEDKVIVTIDNLLLEYLNNVNVIAPRRYGNEQAILTIGNILVDEKNSNTENNCLIAELNFAGGYVQDKSSLRITGQITGISEMQFAFYTLSGDRFGDWREYFTNEDGSHRFSCAIIDEKQENAPNMTVKFYTDTISGDLKIQKKDTEYFIDFDENLYDIWDFEGGNYTQVGDFLYSLVQNGDIGYAYPYGYVGDSTFMNLPEKIEYEGKTYDVTVLYCIKSYKANVEKMSIPSHSGYPFMQADFGKVNDLLPGGAANSAFKEYEVSKDHKFLASDEDGNLYSKNYTVLYSVPPAKTSCTIRDSVLKIAFNAFANSKVRELVIPESVETIETAFDGMNDLEKIVFKGKKPIDFSYGVDSYRNSIFSFCGKTGTVVYGEEITGARNEALRAGFLYEDNVSVYGTDLDSPYEDEVEGYTPGDVDKNDNISANDALLTLKIIAGLENCSTKDKRAADVNRSGHVAADDALLILKKIAGLIGDFEQLLQGDDAYCKLNGHEYQVTSYPSYEAEGEKCCRQCNAIVKISKLNEQYKYSLTLKEPTEWECGEKMVVDFYTGQYETIVTDPLGPQN